jgi:hypothetical protein
LTRRPERFASSSIARLFRAAAVQWSVPIGAFVGKVAKIDGQLVQFQAGPRYYAASTDSVPVLGALLADHTPTGR